MKSVRVSNEPESDTGGDFGELLRLQTEFHSRLAEETLKYLRRIQGASMPAAPGTIILPGAAAHLRAAGAAGATVELKIEVENLQRMHCTITPMLTPLVGSSGVTWFPAIEASPPITLLAPEEVAALVLNVPLPANLPAGAYRGALLLQGFRQGAVAVTVVVTREGESEAAADEQSPVKAGMKAKTVDGQSVARSPAKKKSASRAKKGRRAPVKRA